MHGQPGRRCDNFCRQPDAGDNSRQRSGIVDKTLNACLIECCNTNTHQAYIQALNKHSNTTVRQVPQNTSLQLALIVIFHCQFVFSFSSFLFATVLFIGGDSIEARRHVPPHFLEPEARNGACLPVFWNENILNTHYYGQHLTKINQNCGCPVIKFHTSLQNIIRKCLE